MLFSITFSQDFSKYDDSYGIFILKFTINEKGKAVFHEIENIQCKDCTEEFIKEFKQETIKSFNKARKSIEQKHVENPEAKSLRFNQPIIFKLEDLIKDFDEN